MAKKFMYVCLGILALFVAYHLGANSATSQGLGTAVGICSYSKSSDSNVYVVTDCGDCYRKWSLSSDLENWEYWGNIYGGPSQTQPTTWGDIKARFGESSITR